MTVFFVEELRHYDNIEAHVPQLHHMGLVWRADKKDEGLQKGA
jgi:hypothetical protein